MRIAIAVAATLVLLEGCASAPDAAQGSGPAAAEPAAEHVTEPATAEAGTAEQAPAEAAPTEAASTEPPADAGTGPAAPEPAAAEPAAAEATPAEPAAAEAVTAQPPAEPAAAPQEAAAQPAAPPAPPPPLTAPARDGKPHRWELRAFKDNHVEVWMDGERVPQDRIRREGNRIGVVDASGKVIERLDIPPSWSPEHGAPLPPGTYRRIDGVELVPPASMLGGRLEAVPGSLLAHLRAEHTAADGTKCAYVAHVIGGLPLDQAGVRSHDVVVAVNDSQDASPEAIRAVVRASKPGDKVKLSIIRAGRPVDATVTLAAWDPKHMVRLAGVPPETDPASVNSDPSTLTGAERPAAPEPSAPPAAAPAPAADGASAEDLAAARRRIAELESQLRKEDAVRRAIRPSPMPQPGAGGAPN